MRKIFVILCLIFITNSLSAQLVNIEKKRKGTKNGLQGNVAFSLNLKENTKKILQGGNNLQLQYRINKYTFLLLNDLSLMQVDESNLINKGFQHFRFNKEFGDGFITLEAFAQHQYNTVRLLEQRFISGGGPRIRIYDNDSTFRLYVAPLSMFQYEQLSDSLSTFTRKFKADYYISIWAKIGKLVEISNVTYYQPDYNAFNEFRISSDTSIGFKITERLKFLVLFGFLYDSDPPEDIPNLDYALKNGIRYSF